MRQRLLISATIRRYTTTKPTRQASMSRRMHAAVTSRQDGWAAVHRTTCVSARSIVLRVETIRLVVGFICGESRNIGIEVNGAKVKTITVNSGGWGTVKRSTAVNVHLNMGYNEIRLYNTANWMPDIDYIDLSPATSTGMKGSH